MRLFKVFLKRAMALQTMGQLNTLCGDIMAAFQQERIKADEYEIIRETIDRLYFHDRRTLA